MTSLSLLFGHKAIFASQVFRRPTKDLFECRIMSEFSEHWARVCKLRGSREYTNHFSGIECYDDQLQDWRCTEFLPPPHSARWIIELFYKQIFQLSMINFRVKFIFALIRNSQESDLIQLRCTNLEKSDRSAGRHFNNDVGLQWCNNHSLLFSYLQMRRSSLEPKSWLRI